MPKRTNPFQHLFHHIYRQLGEGAVVTESGELPDRVTSTLREVDILVEQQIAGHKQLLGVECTSAIEQGQRRAADVGWVEQMLAKHRDLPTDHLILVSETGFSKPAITKATFYRAETIVLGDALAEDWTQIAGKERELHHAEINHCFTCSFVVRNSDSKLEYRPARLNEIILLGDGWSGTVGSLVDHMFAQSELRDLFFQRMTIDGTEPFWFNYTPPEGTAVYYVDESGDRKEWERLVVDVTSTRSSAVVQLRSGSIGEKRVAYGEGTGSAGKVMLSVVEENEKARSFMVRLSTGKLACGVCQQQGSSPTGLKPRRGVPPNE